MIPKSATRFSDEIMLKKRPELIRGADHLCDGRRAT
jgi:hypothetical protein